MRFYAGVVPADRPSAQADITRTHPQANPQSPINVDTTSPAAAQLSAYAAVTPAQVYARSLVSVQPTLNYIIERQQPSKSSAQQPAPLLQSPVEASPSPRGQSYAQCLYASALGKQPQPQTTLQTDSRQFSFEPSGEPDSDLRVLPSGRPSRPYGARSRMVSSLMLNLHNDNISSPQPASALDFYHNSVSKLGFRSPVPDGSTSSPEAAHPQSVMSSSSPHSLRLSISQTTRSFYDMQAPSGRGLVPVANSNVPPPSPVRDYQLSNMPELHSRKSSSPVPTLAVPVVSAQISLQSTNSVVSPPASAELFPREFSTNSKGHSRDIAQSAVISSRPESATRNSHVESVCSASLDLGPEEVPLYSLVDDTPPPPDFDESQFICGANAPPSVYHAEKQVVLSPPSAPSPSPSPPPHEFGAVYGGVDSTGADTPALPRNISPDPIPESLRPSSTMEGVPLYYLKKSYGYPAEDFVPQLPEKTRSYLTKEHATTSHPTQHFGQSTYLTTSSTVQQATFSHHPFANPVSQQTATHPLSHHRAAQGSHTQNPCMHHATYLSSGIATRSATSMSMSMSSPGPMPVQHGMQYSYGTPHATSPHHSSLGSYAHVHSAPHPHLPQAQRNAQQQFHTQAGPSQHPSNVGSVQNNAALARQSAKDALIARCSCDVQ